MRDDIVTLGYARKPARVSAVARWSEPVALAAFVLLVVAFVVPALWPPKCRGVKRQLAAAAVGPNSPISSAVNMFEFDTGRLPNKLTELVNRPNDVRTAIKWGGPYMCSSRGLLDPWRRPYQYRLRIKPGGLGYALWSMGKDGVAGTKDDIKSGDDARRRTLAGPAAAATVGSLDISCTLPPSCP